ncbi:MAG: AraC family transcriptional regulator [Eubacteriales bacterium]|nr:AraC family transcriptional regulator [Eubacteriales bacterium]
MKILQQEVFDETEVFFKFIDGNNLLSSPHVHEFYEIFIVTKGAIMHRIDDSQQRLEEGDMLFIRPNDCHALTGKKEDEIINMAFSASVLEAILCLFQRNEPLLEMCNRAQPAMCRLGKERLQNIKKQCREVQSFYSSKATAAIQYKALLVQLLSLLIASSHLPSNQFPLWLDRLVQKMNNVKAFTRDINEIYSMTDRTPEHIARTFQKYMSTTPTEYILQLRINYAKELLLTTDKPVLDICFEAGFNSPSYFHRCFKQEFGMAPGKFKKMNHVKF